jgi:hypothetical protein
VKTLIPLAVNHFYKTFLNRVVKVVFQAVVDYRNERKLKRLWKERAIHYYLHRSLSIGFQCSLAYSNSRFKRKTNFKAGQHFYEFFRFRGGFFNWFQLYHHRIVIFKSIFSEAKFRNYKYLICKGFSYFVKFGKLSFWWRKKTALAIKNSNFLRLKNHFFQLKKIFIMKKDLNFRAQNFRKNKLLTKSVIVMKELVAAHHELIQRLQLELEQKMIQQQLEKQQQEEEERLHQQRVEEELRNLNWLIKMTTRIQARWRGTSARTKVTKLRIAQMYAILVMQRLIRKFLARIKFYRLKRAQNLGVFKEREVSDNQCTRPPFQVRKGLRQMNNYMTSISSSS